MRRLGPSYSVDTLAGERHGRGLRIVVLRSRELIVAGCRVLRHGGLFFASFRSQHYNLLHSVRDRDWRCARLVLEVREGEWRSTSTLFIWQTPSEVRETLTADAFSACSGTPGDPLATIAQPLSMSANDRRHLKVIETSLAEDYAGCGRYLAMATET